MAAMLQFNPAELAQLHLLVAQDAESSRAELLHRTGLPFQTYVKQRLARSTALLKRMDDALPSHKFILDHQWGKSP